MINVLEPLNFSLFSSKQAKATAPLGSSFRFNLSKE
jgi:hypothetical protein